MASPSLPLEQDQHFKLLRDGNVLDFVEHGTYVVSLAPARAQDDCERLLSHMAVNPAIKGLISVQTRNECKLPTFHPPHGVAYRKSSGHGGQTTYRPPGHPAIATQVCNYSRYSKAYEDQRHLDQKFQSYKIHSVTHNRSLRHSGKLICIKPGTSGKPSGKSFRLQTQGSHRFKARACCGELCSSLSTGFGPLADFAGQALRVTDAKSTLDGQELSVTCPDKIRIDFGLANKHLIHDSLSFRETYHTHTAKSEKFLYLTLLQSEAAKLAAPEKLAALLAHKTASIGEDPASVQPPLSLQGDVMPDEAGASTPQACPPSPEMAGLLAGVLPMEAGTHSDDMLDDSFLQFLNDGDAALS